MIKLGQKVKCVVTGFTGIVVSKVEYLSGCIQFCIRPRMKAKDNEMPKSQYIDEGQLVVCGKGVAIKKKIAKKKPPGGVMSNTPNATYQG